MVIEAVLHHTDVILDSGVKYGQAVGPVVSNES